MMCGQCGPTVFASRSDTALMVIPSELIRLMIDMGDELNQYSMEHNLSISRAVVG